MSELVTSLGKQAAPRPRLKRMKQRAIKAADLMQKYLTEGSEDYPDMVTYLADKFYDDEKVLTDVKVIGEGEDQERLEFYKDKISVKEKTNIANFFAREANQRAQVAKAAGLSKFSDKGQTAKTIVNISINGDLPLEERIKLIQAEVTGMPLILPGLPQAQISVNAPERPLAGVATSPVPEVTFPSEIPPAGLTGVQEPLDERIEDL